MNPFKFIFEFLRDWENICVLTAYLKAYNILPMGSNLYSFIKSVGTYQELKGGEGRWK